MPDARLNGLKVSEAAYKNAKAILDYVEDNGLFQADVVGESVEADIGIAWCGLNRQISIECYDCGSVYLAKFGKDYPAEIVELCIDDLSELPEFLKWTDV